MRHGAMTTTPFYAYQKTRAAVMHLATSMDPLPKRTCRACFLLHILTADEIPDSTLQNRLLALMADYESGKPNDDTFSHLDSQGVSRIASEIVDIFDGCVKLYAKSVALR